MTSIEVGSLIEILQEPSPEANDLIKAVDEMLETMTTKFTKISSEVFAKSTLHDG